MTTISPHRTPMVRLVNAAGQAASRLGLHCVLRSAASDAIDPLAAGREQVQVWSPTLRRGMEQRDAARATAAGFFDLHLPALLADPLACVAQIYSHFGLELTDEARERMARFLKNHARDKHGAHRYTLEDFGIDAERDAQDFEEYYSRYGVERLLPGGDET
jgi:hypothetical protein